MNTKQKLTCTAIITTLTLPGVLDAQLTVTDAVGGTPNVAGATLYTFDGTLPSILALTGNAYVTSGTTQGSYTAPYYSGSTAAYFGESPATGADATPYIAVQTGGMATFTFSTPQNYFGILWGSIDAQNTLTFYNSSDSVIGTVTSAQLTGYSLNSSGAAGTVYANISSSAPFSSVVVTTSGAQGDFNFEFDDVAIANVPEPTSLGLLATGIAVAGFVIRRKKA
jgi:hypothetical protein